MDPVAWQDALVDVVGIRREDVVGFSIYSSLTGYASLTWEDGGSIYRREFVELEPVGELEELGLAADYFPPDWPRGHD